MTSATSSGVFSRPSGEGDVIGRLRTMMPIIGYIQFAAVPDRGAPDHGEVDYADVFAEIARLGWEAPLGAE